VGLIGNLLEWSRTTDEDAQLAEGRVDLGGEDIITGPHFQGSGLDGQPLPGDYVVLVPGPETGSYLLAGYIDPKNAGVARPGDVRLYCRDGNGNVVGELHMANDGEPDWQATAGALIARADRVDAALNALGTVFNSHTHAFTHGGTSSSPDVTDAPFADPTMLDPIEQETDHSTGADKGWVT